MPCAPMYLYCCDGGRAVRSRATRRCSAPLENHLGGHRPTEDVRHAAASAAPRATRASPAVRPAERGRLLRDLRLDRHCALWVSACCSPRAMESTPTSSNARSTTRSSREVSKSGDRFFYVKPSRARGSTIAFQWFTCACFFPNIFRFLGEPRRADLRRARRRAGRHRVRGRVGPKCASTAARSRISQRTSDPRDGPGGNLARRRAGCRMDLAGGEFRSGGARAARGRRRCSFPVVPNAGSEYPAGVGEERRGQARPATGASAGRRGSARHGRRRPRRDHGRPDRPVPRGRRPGETGRRARNIAAAREATDRTNRARPSVRGFPWAWAGAVAVEGTWRRPEDEAGSAANFTPDCDWDNRDPGEMVVWVRRLAELAELLGEVGLRRVERVCRLAASHCWSTDSQALTTAAWPSAQTTNRSRG